MAENEGGSAMEVTASGDEQPASSAADTPRTTKTSGRVSLNGFVDYCPLRYSFQFYK